MNTINQTVLSSSDSNVASEEFRSGADFSKSHAEAMQSADIKRVGFGGLVRDESATESAPEATPETERAKQTQGAQPAALPWWLAEKYHWTQGQSGSFYLKPFDEYLNYVVEKSPKAAAAGLHACFPGGERDKTDEAAIVKLAIDEVRALRESLTSLSELEGSSFSKYLVERCLRNAVYAATTQFELVCWSRREAARGNDVSTNDNYGEKVSRKLSFMHTAGALYALIRETFPEADLSDKAFSKMAKRIVYDTARIEADKLKSPALTSEEAKAGLDAAKLTAEDF